MAGTDHPRHLAAVATAAVVTVLWSSSWVLIRVGLEHETLPPLTFAGLRYGLASLVLAGSVATSARHRQATRQLGRRDLAQLWLLGLALYAITQGAQFVAIGNQPAATSSLVISLTPALVAGFSRLAVAERVARAQLVGAGLIAAGAWVFSTGDLGATATGMAAATVGLVANSASSLLGRHVNRSGDTPALVVTAMSMPVGAAALLAGGLAIDGWPRLSATAMMLVAWLAVINTAAAFTLWNRSLRRLTAVESAGMNNTMLIQIAVLGWIFLSEPPGRNGLAGIVIVSIGVFCTQGRPAGRPLSRRPGRDRRHGDGDEHDHDRDPEQRQCREDENDAPPR